MSRRVSVMAGVLVLVFVSGLTTALPFANAQSTVAVSIRSGAGNLSGAPGYGPDSVKLVIGVNNTVTWTNGDTAHHTVTPGNEPAGAAWSQGSGDMAPQATYSFTFTVPGTYAYHCNYHSWMTGTVVVEAASTTSTTTTTPEFPAVSLAVILFAVIAAVMLAVPRLRPTLSSGPGSGTSKSN